MYQEFTEPTSMLLNTAPPQFTSGGNKTQNAMDYIKYYSTLHNTSNNGKQHGYHHMTCIFTNNSLAETEQWIVRTGKEFSETNIFILSSKKKGKNKEKIKFKTRAELTDYILHAKRNALPDILIMCSNSTRIHDICDLLDDFKRGTYNIKPLTDYNGITFNIMIDEADKSTGAIKHLLHSGHVRQDRNSYGPLIDVMFITATPFKKFWDLLTKEGINTLKMNWLYNQWGGKGHNYETLNKGYRQITDHNHIPEENQTGDPTEYIYDVFNRIDTTQRLVIYAPAGIKINTHENISDFFLEQNFIVLIHNGRTKEFRIPQKEPINIETYKDLMRKEPGQDPDQEYELREILVHISNDPDYSIHDIAITGCLTIERGITFNTTGFQFTHMILSSYHTRNMASVVQMFGRGNGSIEYVGVFNIICPTYVWNSVTTTIENIKSILENEPQEVSSSDFKTITDPNYQCKNVPIIHPITQDQYELFKKPNSKNYDRVYILSLLTEYEWLDEYSMNIQEVTAPGPSTPSYKKHITALVNLTKSNMRGIIDAGCKIKDVVHKKLMWIYIDMVEFRLVITRWDGSKYKLR